MKGNKRKHWLPLKNPGSDVPPGKAISSLGYHATTGHMDNMKYEAKFQLQMLKPKHKIKKSAIGRGAFKKGSLRHSIVCE